MAALEAIGQLFMVDAEKMHDGGLKIMNVYLIFHRIETKVIGSPVGHSGFSSASRHPYGEGIRVVIASPSLAILDVTLNEWRAAKFASPDDQGVVEHTTHLEVLYESGAGLIGVAALVV